MFTEGQVMDISRQAIYTIILTSAPLLLTSLIVGLIISIFQTVTSIQEQTLTRSEEHTSELQSQR